jgi:hypothetical protein
MSIKTARKKNLSDYQTNRNKNYRISTESIFQFGDLGNS